MQFPKQIIEVIKHGRALHAVLIGVFLLASALAYGYYQDWVSEVMGAQEAFAPCPPAATRPTLWPPTRYEAKALRAGRRPKYWSFARLPPG